MGGLTGEELLRLPVRHRGIVLGTAVEVLLHPTAPRALGIDVLCGDENHRFLPFAAATLGADSFEVESPFVLVDLTPESAYRTRARALSGLRGTFVSGSGSELRDVVLGPEWTIDELVVADGGKTIRVPLDGNVLRRRRPARRSSRRRSGRRPR